MTKEKRRDARIGICSEHFRPQKYEVRDPRPDLPFAVHAPSWGDAGWPTLIVIALAAGLIVGYLTC